MTELVIKTPRWALPFLAPRRYKGIKGGRSSGKSHFFAELLVEECIIDDSLPVVCLREVQKSIKFSVKRLIESKIQAFGAGSLFDVLETEIRRKNGTGIIIFQGLQDHTAESIKSLEGFRRAWVEEAQAISARSLQLLIPTIMRTAGAEMWASWNPNQPTDPVETLFSGLPEENKIVRHVNYADNPFLGKEALEEISDWRRRDPDTFDHVWLGGYNRRSEQIIFSGRFEVDDFTPNPEWSGPYFGADWGFSQDPTTLIKCYVGGGNLYIAEELYRVGLEITDTPAAFRSMADADRYVIRADCSRPETISHVKRAGLKIEAADKWPGSVADGIAFMRGFNKIIIHSRCKHTADEFGLYSYRTDRLTGDVLPDIIDANNHAIDAIRYALAPLIKPKPQAQVW